MATSEIQPATRFPVAALFFAAAVLLPAPCFGSAPQRRPSVVLIVLDSLRADRTSPYGYAKSATPALGKFAEEAAVFENAYSNSNWTGASFASILTGKRPFSHGLLGYFDRLPQDAATIQTLLARNGYETAAFPSGLAAAARYGLTRGFGQVIPPVDFKRMSSQVPQIMEWKNKLSPEKDFFILFHGGDIVWPYSCSPDEAGDKADLSGAERDSILYYSDVLPKLDFSRIDPAKWKKALADKRNPDFLSARSHAYDQCVSRLDNAVSSLLQELQAEKARPLLIIITADHGEFLGEHGLIGHGKDFSEPVVRVPLLILFPGGHTGRRIRTVAEHVDLLPTICASAGIVCPAGLDGKDLAATPEKKDRNVKWAAAGGGDINSRAISAAFSDNGKKIALRGRNWRLFDLRADPGETTDLAQGRPEEFLRMASAYLAISGAAVLADKNPVSGESAEDCAPQRSLFRDAPDASTPCELARLTAFRFAKEHDFNSAKGELAGSGCPSSEILRDEESLELIRQAMGATRVPSYQGYAFSTSGGRWKMRKDGISVIYSAANGLECRNEKDGSPHDAGCVPPAAALLNCIEKYRFSVDEAGTGDRHLEEALRKAGYIQ